MYPTTFFWNARAGFVWTYGTPGRKFMIMLFACRYNAARFVRFVSMSALLSRAKSFGLLKPHWPCFVRKNVPMKLSGSPKSPVQPIRLRAPAVPACTRET